MARRRGDPGMAANAIPGLLRQGLGPTAALRSFRAAGGSISDQSWFRAWRQVADSLERAGAVAEAPLRRRPETGEVQASGWQTKQRYTYMVDVTFRVFGTRIIETRTLAVTSDRLLTYGSALQSALDTFAEGEDEPSGENQVGLGGVVVGVYDRDLGE